MHHRVIHTHLEPDRTVVVRFAGVDRGRTPAAAA